MLDAVEEGHPTINSLRLDSIEGLIRGHMACKLLKTQNCATQTVNTEKRRTVAAGLDRNHQGNIRRRTILPQNSCELLDCGCFEKRNQGQFSAESLLNTAHKPHRQ